VNPYLAVLLAKVPVPPCESSSFSIEHGAFQPRTRPGRTCVVDTTNVGKLAGAITGLGTNMRQTGTSFWKSKSK
jgi:hypothetical protein